MRGISKPTLRALKPATQHRLLTGLLLASLVVSFVIAIRAVPAPPLGS